MKNFKEFMEGTGLFGSDIERPKIKVKKGSFFEKPKTSDMSFADRKSLERRQRLGKEGLKAVMDLQKITREKNLFEPKVFNKIEKDLSDIKGIFMKMKMEKSD